MAINLAIVSKFDDSGLKKIDKSLGGLGKSFKSIAGIAAGALASIGIAQFAKDSVNAASSLEESLNAVNVAFGDAADAVLKIGENSATALGVSQTEFNQAAVRFSAFAERVVGEGGNVAGFIGDISQRATDFASVFNIDVAEALQVFQSGLSGEAEPLKRFGINLLDSEVKAFAYANGIAKVGEELTEAEKVQARYGLLMESTNKTAGDFANTSDGLANSQRILDANITNLQASIGSALLPVLASLTASMLPIAEQIAPLLQQAFENLAPVLENIGMFVKDQLIPALFAIGGWVSDNIPTIATFVGTLGGLLIAFNAVTIATRALAVAQGILNAIMAINPLTIVAIAVAALAAGIVYLATQTTFFQDTWKAVTTFVSEQWEAFGKLFSRVGKAIGDFFTTIVTNISDSWKQTVEDVSNLLNTLGRFFSNAFTTIRNTVVNAVSDFGTLLFNAGQDLIQGLINGVLNIGQKIKDTIVNVVDGAVQGVKDLLGIRSPSRVFTDIGENIGEGMVRGIDSKIGAVSDSAKKLAQAAVPSGYEWVMGPNGPYLESSAFVSGKSNKGVSDFGAASASFLLRQQGLSQEEIDRVLTKTIGGTLNQVNATMNKGVTLINKATNTKVMGNLTAADVANKVAEGFEVVEKIARPVGDLEKSVADLVGKIQAGDTAYLKPMATGGIVTGPTPALIGEAGPEAVIPLSRLGDMGGPTYNITVNAGIGTDGRNVGQLIVDEIKKFERRSGKVFVSA